MTFGFGNDFVFLCLIRNKETHLRIGTVLALRQQIGCCIYCVGGAVGYNGKFRRTCGHIYCGFRRVYQLLGNGYKAVARAKNLRHLGNSLGTVSHCGDSLSASDFKNLGYAQKFGAVEHHRIDVSAATGRRAEHNLLAACEFGRNSEHQHGREQRCAAAGDVDSHLFDAHGLLPTDNAVGCGHFLYLRGYLALVKLFDISLGGEDSLFEVFGHFALSLNEFLLRYQKIVGTGVVEFHSKFAHSTVAAVAHRIQNLLNHRDNVVGFGGGTF